MAYECQDEISYGRYCIFKTHAYLIFETKYQRDVFTKNMIDDLKSMLQKVCLHFEADLDGEDDHIHLLVDDLPKITVSSLVNRLKRSIK